MSEFAAWPFLVSRNKTVDYRVILAPDFMVSSGHSHLLANWASGQESSQPIRREVSNPQTGNLSIVFRIIKAQSNAASIKDEFGRPILRIEGLVFRENTQNYNITEQLLDKINALTQIPFQRFWSSGSDFAVIPSSAVGVSLTERIASKPIAPQEPVAGWSTTRSQTQVSEKYSELQQMRESADRNYKIGLACSIIGVPLIPVFGVGIIVIPIGGVIALVNYQKRTEIDEQIKNLESKLKP